MRSWRRALALVVTAATITWIALWLLATRDPMSFWQAGVGALILIGVTVGAWRWEHRVAREEGARTRWLLGAPEDDDHVPPPHRSLSGKDEPPTRW